jgi:hypothetical protein
LWSKRYFDRIFKNTSIFPLSVAFQQCSTLIFVYMMLLPGEQKAEACEPSNTALLRLLLLQGCDFSSVESGFRRFEEFTFLFKYSRSVRNAKAGTSQQRIPARQCSFGYPKTLDKQVLSHRSDMIRNNKVQIH